jgi:hypothetical protein
VRPTPRECVYDTYGRFAAERHAIFVRRQRGEEGPWTEDRILRRFKFCNTFRAADRVTQYLIREVIYGPAGEDLPAEDVVLRVVLFRLFSRESTWDAIEAASGGRLMLATFDEEALGDALEDLKRERAIYTSAFILAAPHGFGHQAKHRNHLALVASMMRGGLAVQLANARSLRDIYEALVGYPAIGPFLGYQIAVDLNYTEHFDFSENDFVMPGPGALRGLHNVFSDPGDRSPAQLILEMVDRQEDEFARLGLEFGGLFGRPLHAIDCQSLFCETDKYSREAFPELKSNRARIKQEFRPTATPLPLAFPPKWGLDGHADLADRGSSQPARHVGTVQEIDDVAPVAMPLFAASV